MRVVTWNCNGALRRKFERIDALNADVLVIQECENPALSSADYRDWAGSHIWAGSSASKGMGVFVKNGLSVSALDWESHGLQQFLPVRISDRLNLLAVWTKNVTTSNMGYIGQFWQYWNHNRALLTHKDIVCGDFNSNSIWDKRGRVWNHTACVDSLEQSGFKSLYHKATGELQGKEKIPTLYLQRNILKPYHIDYIFCHLDAIPIGWSEIKVGLPDDWLSISDHMPVCVDL